MQTIHLSQLRPGPNPRTYFDERAMEELTASVRQRGVIQPIVVRPIPGEKNFQIIAGERRFRAAIAAFNGDYDIPVVVKNVGDEEAEAISLTENVLRDDMSVAETAVAAQKMVLRNSGDKDEAARQLGWSREKLDRRLALLHCSKEVRDALTRRTISVGHAELLATLAQDRQNTVLDRILAHGVSVVDLKAQLGQFAYRLSDAIFDTAQCTNCIHSSARQRMLFGEHIDADGVCTNPAHYQLLTEEVLRAKADALKDDAPLVKIVRPEDGFLRIRIVAEGQGAVGEEQARACRTCANFGCAVSGIPGQLGTVFEENCFDAACNTVKQGAYIKARKAKDAPPPAPSAKGPTPTTKPAVAASNTPAPSSTTPRAVIEYRIAQWRQMLAAVLARNPTLALRFLLAFGLDGAGRWIDSIKLKAATAKVSGRKVSVTTFETALAAVNDLGDELLQRLAPLVPACAAFGMDTSQLEVALEWAGVDETDHLVVSEDFLKLLTKSEIEAVADEIGLKAHLGDGFKKLAVSKKDELIAGLLNAKGFDFKGKLPKVLRYRRRKG